MRFGSCWLLASDNSVHALAAPHVKHASRTRDQVIPREQEGKRLLPDRLATPPLAPNQKSLAQPRAAVASMVDLMFASESMAKNAQREAFPASYWRSSVRTAHHRKPSTMPTGNLGGLPQTCISCLGDNAI
nr:hypothetical protein CFP56_11159 [Quercus suber]